ncbi:MAG TPA: hypothetical protein VM734_07760 [Kofleriaceae bacterium]|nr:hypothetical protein [Kofleriaceae bacterium]
MEVTGAWGVQLGQTDYLPDDAPDEFKHPIANGWTVGGTVGWSFARNLAVFADYQFRTAWTRHGEIPTVLDDVQGRVHYHTISAGVRMYRPLSFGALRADLAIGMVPPFHTKLKFEYGPALAAAGIEGEGTMENNFGWAFGMQAELGYEIPVGPLYLAFGFGVRGFQGNDNDHDTKLDNFVVDLAARPPVATTAVIRHGDFGDRPMTYALSDVTARLSLGVWF